MAAQFPFSKLTTNDGKTVFIYYSGGLYRACAEGKKFVYRNHCDLIVAIIEFCEEKWDKLINEVISENVKPLQSQEMNH